MKVLYEVWVDIPEGMEAWEMRDTIYNRLASLPMYYSRHEPLYKLNTRTLKVSHIETAKNLTPRD